MIELSEKRAEKEGRVTPKALISNLYNQVENGEIETIVYVAVEKSGTITTGWSDTSQLKALGMFEMGKTQTIETMRE